MSAVQVDRTNNVIVNGHRTGWVLLDDYKLLTQGMGQMRRKLPQFVTTVRLGAPEYRVSWPLSVDEFERLTARRPMDGNKRR